MMLSDPAVDTRYYARIPDEPTFVLDRQRHYGQSAAMKPRGLWFSVQDDWDRWVCGEDMDWTSDRQVYRVVIKPFDALLRVTTVEELDAFTLKYGQHDPRWARIGPDRIDWPAVASEYPGIAIYPYLWPRRLDGGASWYYSWDCASGCVWDLDLVRCVIPLFHTIKQVTR